MIRIDNLSKNFEGFRLKNINLEIKKEEYFIILGPSGSGKTLLLEMIAGLMSPDTGTISVKKPLKIGLIYQDYMLFPHLNVYQNIAFGLKIKKGKKEEMDSVVKSVSQSLEIHHLLSRSIDTLSGGEKQRVSIARAMAIQPHLYLLDEPTAALDLSAKTKIQKLIMHLHKRDRTTVIHVTHDFEEALALGDRIAILFDGQIVQLDKPERVFNNPASRQIADFLGYKNVFSGKIKDTQMSLNGIRVTTPVEEAESAYIAIRSNDIIISMAELSSSARNSFPGKIVDIIQRTNHAEVVVDIGVRLQVDITLQSLKGMALSAGIRVWVAFKTQAIKVFEH